jgi:hypothetical protein
MLGSHSFGSTDAPHSRTKGPLSHTNNPGSWCKPMAWSRQPKQLQPPQLTADANRHLCDIPAGDSAAYRLREVGLRQPNQVQCVILGPHSTCAQNGPSEPAQTHSIATARRPLESCCCPFCGVDKDCHTHSRRSHGMPWGNTDDAQRPHGRSKPPSRAGGLLGDTSHPTPSAHLLKSPQHHNHTRPHLIARRQARAAGGKRLQESRPTGTDNSPAIASNTLDISCMGTSTTRPIACIAYPQAHNTLTSLQTLCLCASSTQLHAHRARQWRRKARQPERLCSSTG